ncbi:hypothetical protein COSO111634_34430 [Corallococcus soli]
MRSSAASGSSGPDTVQRSAPLTAATSSVSESSGRTSSADIPTASIPPEGSRDISSPRTTASRSASSNDSTPATQAAAYSPKLCPRSAVGLSPNPIHHRASETSTASSAGSAKRGSARAASAPASPPGGGNSTGRRSCFSPTDGSRARHDSSASWKRGSVSNSSRAMPTDWAPWPGKRKATRREGGASRSRTVDVVPGFRSASTSPVTSSATTVRRTSKPLRPTLRVKATSARSTSARASTASARERVTASSAAGVRADSVTSCLERRGPCSLEAGSRGGASSNTTCALVPPMPNELTAARRGPWVRSHGRSVVFTKKGLRAKSISGLGCSKWRLGGTSAWCSASAALMRPAMPAAVSRCPMFVFTDPSAQ